jgi:hypothetical protein
MAGMALLFSTGMSVEVALYIADQGNNKIKMLLLASYLSTTVATVPALSGITVYQYKLFAVVPGAVLKYNIQPYSYALGSSTLFSGSIATVGTSDGTLASATYGDPNYIKADSVGNLYVSDSYTTNGSQIINGIRRISLTENDVASIAGNTG